MKKTKHKVSIIIVNYKSEKHLIGCLKSIRNCNTKIKHEVIVVDNEGSESLAEKLKRNFKWVNYIKSPKNIGYGAGNNLGAKIAKGEYLFILNPDTKLKDKCLDKLASFLDKNQKVAIVAPNFIDKSKNVFENIGSRELTPIRGIVCLSFINKLFPNNPISREYWLKDKNKNKKREVDVVPGSAFLIRKSVFEKIGGFDESMFLFFEEAELGKRVRDMGWRIYINPQAEITHYWRSSKRSKRLKDYYNKSRFYYFSKHYGALNAFLVELFARFSKWHALMILITFLASFIRLYDLSESMWFHAELAHVYLEIKNYIIRKEIPLIGPATSHPWLSFGPLYYWILGPILMAFKYDPLAGAYFMAIVGVLVVILNYWVISHLFNKNIGLISSYLLAISPLFSRLVRGSMLFSLVVIFFYPLLFFLVKSIKKDGKFIFWVGLSLGIMLNFHLTPIIIIPAILTVIFLFKQSFKKSDLTLLLTGLFIPNVPLVIHDLKRGFPMFSKLIIWIPYRVAGFLGLYPKNNLNSQILSANVKSFLKFISESIVIDSQALSQVAVIIFFISLAYLLRLVLRDKKKKVVAISLLLILVWGYIGIFVHGDPPSHYYLPLYPIPIILYSYFIAQLLQKKAMLLAILLIALISFNNFSYYFSDKWFYRPRERTVDGSVPYLLQKSIVDFIISDANKALFELKRVGVLDQYQGNFADNYQYLLWVKGNEPVKVGELVVDRTKEADVSYTISEDEDTEELTNNYERRINIGNVIIVKEKI